MPDFKLLEINIISAQDLPPVSKTLRTFAAVYIDPGHKLTTRVDQRGSTNPTWNYKVAFQVDDEFLKSESSAVTFEIYNVTWLRDLPIGTTHLLINNLSPTLRRNSSERTVKIPICTASGHLQGTLNLGLHLVGNAIPGSSEISISRTINEPDEENLELDATTGLEMSKDEDLFPSAERRIVTRPGSEHETENYTTHTYSNSLFSAMRPLPSEVAADMKKWLYSNQGDDFGSSIFENWTEAGGKIEKHAAQSKNVMSRYDQKVTSNKSLFSCIGNAYGFEFSFICGSKKWKSKRDERKKKQNFQLIGLPEENLRRFYV
ncbi:hypothetical protein F511_24472 [Dorcoceras hygrometricum]|uniref:C2 domain-containing protein n=1 Tax=Dorcoceras hygrometricum TaxID=472368 RepID=A0A2Z7BXX3_9LAMI|nr:hypothetical protein F511_24472 [Dorcoceras hygrometricum]